MKTSTSVTKGERFGRLTVQEVHGGKARCLCDCGAETEARTWHLLHAFKQSCGCLRRDRMSDLGKASGSHFQSYSKTYNSWRGMIARCTNPNNSSWRYYGARDIRVCARWYDFSNFLADMGERPEGKTLDRIDPGGHYEPGNCRWATPAEQTANRSYVGAALDELAAKRQPCEVHGAGCDNECDPDARYEFDCEDEWR